MVRSLHPAQTYKEPTAVKLWRYGMMGGGIVLALLILYCGAWGVTAYMMRDSLQTWFSAQAAAGRHAAYNDQETRITGFPFRVQAALPDVVIQQADQSDPLSWSLAIPRLEVSIVPLPWRIDRVTIQAPQGLVVGQGEQRFDIQAQNHRLTFSWLSQTIPSFVSASVEALKVRPLVDTEGGMTLAQGKIHAAASSETQDYDVRLTLDGLRVGPAVVMDQVIMDARLTQGFYHQAFTPEGLAQWRDQGGVATIERLLIEGQPTTVQGNGTVGLDARLQPVGTFNARIGGFFDLVDRMSAQGMIRRQDATMAKVMLGMLAKRPEGGGAPVISVALSVQNQRLYVGPVALMAVPEISW